MRVWDVPPEKLCRSHLLGEHREVHAVWSIITEGKRAYAHHPETKRWRGKLRALYLRHQADVAEMARRGYAHHSPLPEDQATGAGEQTDFVDSPEQQLEVLKAKGCACRV